MKCGTISRLCLLTFILHVCCMVHGGKERHRRVRSRHRARALRGSQGCRLPRSWSGSWFQSGVREVVDIGRRHISIKGNCTEHDGDMYLLHHQSSDCYRCLVITEKHKNVLQYKESYCSPKNTLESICEQITGDAQLFSLFRENARPTRCPFVGHFKFSYDVGYGSCGSPHSEMDSCTNESQLRLKYRACPDVFSSESKDMELSCLATWKDGFNQFMVAKFKHEQTIRTREEEYRCFLYSSSTTSAGGYDVAYSGDATCNGLFSSTNGPTRLTLEHDRHPSSQCKFPGWLSSQQRWRSLGDDHYYRVKQKNSTWEVLKASHHSHHLSQVSKCLHVHHITNNSAQIITFNQHGCEKGYKCLRLFRRSDHIVELQEGMLTFSRELACSDEMWSEHTRDHYRLLVADGSLPSAPCPQPGEYRVVQQRFPPCTNPASFKWQLGVGCNMAHRDRITLQHTCDNERGVTTDDLYKCHGWWSEGGVHYVVGSESWTGQTVCLVSQWVDRRGGEGGGEGGEGGVVTGGHLLRLSASAESCRRPQSIHPAVTESERDYHLTPLGPCASSSAATTSLTSLALLLTCLILTRHVTTSS